MTITLHAHALEPTDFEESLLSPPAAEPLSGEIAVRSKVIYTSNNQQIAAGTWESEPGLSRWEFLSRGEVIHIIHGRMIATRDGEDPVELREGTTAVFPQGWTGTWRVLEKLRKVFVVYRSDSQTDPASGR
ncbi:cupin domain-containing protein [Arthrobacter sp. NyZ413]|uniref:cupin domain-containing protein n=1 Tax=Arthrobacter sp. NyZ413 TaxID=3144669 RepID=UPI003BF828A4